MGKHKWEKQGIELEYFSEKEFRHPELMDAGFLRELETLRMRCGFPIRINNDARSPEEHKRIYRKEIEKGESYPTESAHLYLEEIDVRAVDMEPSPPTPDDGCSLTLDERELVLTGEIYVMYKEGRWKHLGLGIETGHWHVDDTPRLGERRPKFWVAVSK